MISVKDSQWPFFTQSDQHNLSLIVTAKLNDVDPQAWLADVLARIADLPQHRLAELLPWNWKPDTSTVVLAQAA